MDYITLHNIGDFSGDGGYMSHQWPVLGMRMPSPVIIFGGAFAVAIMATAVMFALLRVTVRKARTSDLLFSSAAFAVAFMLIFMSLATYGLSSSYEDRYSPYEENMGTFSSSYGINPNDVSVDQSDCTGSGPCRFDTIFRDDGMYSIRRARSSWLMNQNGDGKNRPVRITVTTPEGIRHMTIRMEGNSHLYLYEGTGDGQRLVTPNKAES